MTSNVGFFNGRLGIAKSDPKVSVYINTQDAIKLPCGFTSQRPAGLNVEPGMMRYNTTTGKFEGYSGETGSEAWGSLGDGSGGGGGGGSGTTSGATGDTTLQGQTLDSVDPNMSQLMTNQASVVGGGDFEVMGSGTHANLDIIAPAGSANLNLKVGTASSTGATIGWNNTVIDFNKKVKINGDLTLTGNLLESDGVTPRVFSNWTVATNPNDIYRGTGYVGIGTIDPQTRLHVNKDGQTMILEGATSASGYCYMGLYPNGYSAGEKAFIGYPSAGWTSLVINNKNNEPIQFWTNNTEKMRLDKDGNLDVNGSIKSSVFLKLDNGYSLIWGEGKSKIAGFGGSTGNITFQTNSLTRMKIDSDGNVGIGTTEPSNAELHIGNSGRIRFGTKSHLGDQRSGNGTGHVYNDTYGLYWSNCHADNAQSIGAKIIGINRLGTSSAYNITYVDLAFSLVNEYGGSTGVYDATSEIMRLKATNDGGRVGIGTTVPRSKFQVSMGEGDIWTTGTTVADCHMLIGGNEWGTSGSNETLKIGLGYFDSETNNIPMYIGCRLITSGGYTNSALVFATRLDDNSATPTYERMCILPSGNVGVGTTNPTNLFHIGGYSHPDTPTMRVKGDALFGNDYVSVKLRFNGTNSVQGSHRWWGHNLGAGDTGSGLNAKAKKTVMAGKAYFNTNSATSTTYLETGTNADGDGGGSNSWWGGFSKYKVRAVVDTGSDGIVLSQYDSESDRRIKHNIIEQSGALQKVLDIELKQYKYNNLSLTGELVYGFIAQQVKEVYEPAIDYGEGSIHDINKYYDFDYDSSNNIIKLFIDDRDNSYNEIELVFETKYVEKDNSGNDYFNYMPISKKTYTIKNKTENYIEIDYTNKEKHPDRIFATGHYIRDFHYIQKQRIFTLHHGAIQEIHKEQQADKVEIAELKAKNTEMEAKIAELEAKNITLENELKEMKTMLNALKSHLGL